MNTRRQLLIALGTEALLAGCAITPESLLASSTIVEELEPEGGATVEVARFSQGTAGGRIPGEWEHYRITPATPRTEYRLAATREGIALEALADRSASGFYRRIRIDPKRHPIIEWRWNVTQPVLGADPRIPSREDSPARLVISFHGEVTRLDFEERLTLRLYKALTGQTLPYAMLMYIWASAVPPETVIPNVHTGKIQMIVVESDEARLGGWVRFRRNVLEDYRRVFGEEPWDIVSVGVMTDSDDTSQQARCLYGDITFLRGQ